MQKVTLNENLFPCTRTIVSENSVDLTSDLEFAKRFVRAACQCFWLQRGLCRFSGFRSSDAGELRVEVWVSGRLTRVARFHGLPYSGVLFVDLAAGVLTQALGADILGELRGESSEPLRVSFEGEESSLPRRRHPCSMQKVREEQLRQTFVVAQLLNHLEAQR